MVELFFVRHGQPMWVKDGKADDEPCLTQLGHTQAARCAEAFKGQHFDGFFVSSLLRARQTAEPIAKVLGMEPVVMDWMQEYKAKDMAGCPGEEVNAYFEQWRLTPLYHKLKGPQGGESFVDLITRITPGLEQTLKSQGLDYKYDGPWRLWNKPPKDMRILFVGHTFASNVMINHLLDVGHTPWEGERFRMSWGSYSKLASFDMADGFIWRLCSVNVRTHLEGLPVDD